MESLPDIWQKDMQHERDLYELSQIRRTGRRFTYRSRELSKTIVQKAGANGSSVRIVAISPIRC